jgi:hypothetical protein
MNRIMEFVRDGGGLTEAELFALVRERMQKIPDATQRNWLRQVILALDGYGGAGQKVAGQQVKDCVKRLDADLPA